MHSTPSSPLAARLLSGLLALLLIVEPALQSKSAYAQVVAASGAGRPTVESAQNGVPLVQIVAPNGAGVSHNVYQSYSVDARGVVLNNSQVIVATQQAGYIAGNPNLAGGSARIILNEVAGTNPSDLRGFTEVAGAKADVVIANPNGITCNGCGFINTGRGVLTTGTPVFGGSGSLDAFRVTGGTITIGANGMEGRYADQIDLLARSVSIQGTLRANTANVVAGANQVPYANLAATPIAGDGATPTTAIDVADVGGMYANKIHLVATEAGVGVNSQGTLVALAGDFRLDAAGNITQGGVISASDGLDLSTTGDIANTGSLFGRDITIQANNLTNSGTGVIAGGNSVQLYVTDTLANLDGALIYSGGALAIAGNADRGEDGGLTTKTAHLVNSSADILAEGDLDIAASVIDNKRTTFLTDTRTVGRSTLLAQDWDDDWDGELIGRTFANSLTTVVTTTEMVRNPDWPYDLIPVEVTRTIVTPYDSSYWHVPGAASIPTFAMLNRGSGARRIAIVSEELQDYLVSASAESRIIGRNVRVLADTLNNAASRFEASGDLTATVSDRVRNDGSRLLNRTLTTTWLGFCSDIGGAGPGRLGYCRDGGGFRWAATPVTSNQTETADSPASTITAAGNYTLNAGVVSNGTAGAGSFGNPGRIGTLGNPGAYLFGLPGGGLYTVNPDGSSRYVVETDPRFTQFGNFIGSDYMLGLLGLDPMATEKRLGDAYYEQQMVRDQLLRLRGKTEYRAGSTLNAEYQALLESGAEFARDFHLAPGVSLTQEQVAALSRDIVWLETRKVAGQDVLVPVVYLGASYTPRSVSALMGGGKNTTITATDILNQSGTISGDTLVLDAANDIVNESGTLEGQDVTLTAGRDIKASIATTAVELHAGQTFTLEGEASRIEAQTLSMRAGHDLSLQGADFRADQAILQAGNVLTIGSQEISTDRDLHGVDYQSHRSEQRGSTFDIKTDLTLVAGNDLTVSGSDIKAGQNLTAYAGNTLAIVTARETETLSTSAHSKTVDDVRQTNRDTGQTSTLSAGNTLTLVAGNTLYTEGATLKAGGDANLQADTVVIASRHDTHSETGSYSNIGKRGSQQSQTQIQTDEATGSIVDAGGNLNIQSGGDTIVEGSALAAGKEANIDVSGDLKLLAAQSSRYQDLYRSSRGAKEATELKYHEERVNQLLSTITVGTGAKLNVGGNFSAAIAEKNEDGSFKADRMTVDGIVRGDSRQQVDVKRTGDAAEHAVNPDGTPAKTQTSEVLGDLKAQGIRNGANDNFDQKATQTGTEALQAYLQSGLIQVRSDPQVAAKLNRILQNSEGATLTYKDDSGKVSLTVAGQAKVQEVFNTLKLTETFDKKHFADQQTAMIVTLIVAIVLTICTAGAAGVAIAGALQITSAAAITMINAAVIGMASTMVGQLAGGADFDDAFQAGVKAGAISAVTAGIAYGAGYAVDSMNGVGGTAGNTAGATGTGANNVGNAAETANTANSANTVNTVQSGTQTIEVGSKTAQGMSGVQKLTNTVWWEKTALNAVGQGAFAEAQGGSFKDGFKGAMIGSVAASSAEAIGDATDKNPFGNILGHAVLGCAVASASKLDCGSGALGGAASASLARVIDSGLKGTDLSDTTQKAIIAGGSIAGTALIASATGKDMMTAANAAANEVTNNYLNHREASELEAAKERRRQCETQSCAAAADQDIKRLQDLDRTRNAELEKACQNPSSAACLGETAKVNMAAASYGGKADGDDFHGTVGKERAESKTLADEYSGRVRNAGAYNAVVGTAGSVVKGVVGVAELGVLSAKAAAGDQEAILQLSNIAKGAGEFLASPIDSTQKAVQDTLARADALESAGKVDEAQRLRAELFTEGLLTVTGAGALATKGGSLLGKAASDAGKAGASQVDKAGAKVGSTVDGEMAGQYGSRVTVQKRSTQELLALENETNAHYLAKHGDHVTIKELEIRANTGRAPDGSQAPFGQTATRWLNNDDMLTAIRDAQQKLAVGDFQLSPDGATRIVTVKFPNTIGDGVLKNSTAQTGYFQTNTAVVRFPVSGNKPYTAYPIK